MIRPFSPYKKICEVPLFRVQAALITIFKNWGVPQWLKVDNGRPFGDPRRETIPALALWLIALGIKVIWNRPRTPQDNAKVERSQGVLSHWTEFEKATDYFDLQIRLWKEADFHNYHFPLRRFGYQGLVMASYVWPEEAEVITSAGADFTFNTFAEAGVGFAEHAWEALYPEPAAAAAEEGGSARKV